MPVLALKANLLLAELKPRKLREIFDRVVEGCALRGESVRLAEEATEEEIQVSRYDKLLFVIDAGSYESIERERLLSILRAVDYLHFSFPVDFRRLITRRYLGVHKETIKSLRDDVIREAEILYAVLIDGKVECLSFTRETNLPCRDYFATSSGGVSMGAGDEEKFDYVLYCLVGTLDCLLSNRELKPLSFRNLLYTSGYSESNSEATDADSVRRFLEDLRDLFSKLVSNYAFTRAKRVLDGVEKIEHTLRVFTEIYGMYSSSFLEAFENLVEELKVIDNEVKRSMRSAVAGQYDKVGDRLVEEVIKYVYALNLFVVYNLYVFNLAIPAFTMRFNGTFVPIVYNLDQLLKDLPGNISLSNARTVLESIDGNSIEDMKCKLPYSLLKSLKKQRTSSPRSKGQDVDDAYLSRIRHGLIFTHGTLLPGQIQGAELVGKIVDLLRDLMKRVLESFTSLPSEWDSAAKVLGSAFQEFEGELYQLGIKQDFIRQLQQTWEGFVNALREVLARLNPSDITGAGSGNPGSLADTAIHLLLNSQEVEGSARFTRELLLLYLAEMLTREKTPSNPNRAV